jgi:hypothetical protein
MVRQIRADAKERGYRYDAADLSARFGVSKRAIKAVVSGQNWKQVS